MLTKEGMVGDIDEPFNIGVCKNSAPSTFELET
jgi:hypothetical protein